MKAGLVCAGLSFAALCGAVADQAANSPLMRGGMAAVPLSVDVAGAKDLTLMATVGPDTYDFDQAVWGEPRLVLADGRVVDLTSLKPVSASVGYGSLLVNKAHNGALQIAGERLSGGFWAHAPSELTFALPAGAVRFEARVGLTSPKGKGSVVFRAEAGNQAEKRALARRLARVNPEALQRLAEWRLKRTPEQAAPLKEALARIRSACGGPLDAADPARVAELEALARKLGLETNPAVTFDEILFIRRRAGRYLPQNWQSNSVLPKNGHDNTLCALRVRGAGAGTVREILTPPNGAFIGDLDLHWDGDRLLYSSVGASNAWHVFELKLADGSARQVSRDNEPEVNH